MIIRSESSDLLVLCCTLRCWLRISDPPVALLLFFFARDSVPRTSTRYSNLKHGSLEGALGCQYHHVRLTILVEVSPAEVLRYPARRPPAYRIYFALAAVARRAGYPVVPTACPI